MLIAVVQFSYLVHYTFITSPSVLWYFSLFFIPIPLHFGCSTCIKLESTEIMHNGVLKLRHHSGCENCAGDS